MNQQNNSLIRQTQHNASTAYYVQLARQAKSLQEQT